MLIRLAVDTSSTVQPRQKPRHTPAEASTSAGCKHFRHLNPAFLPCSSFDLPCVATEALYACIHQPFVDSFHFIDDQCIKAP